MGVFECVREKGAVIKRRSRFFFLLLAPSEPPSARVTSPPRLPCLWYLLVLYRSLFWFPPAKRDGVWLSQNPYWFLFRRSFQKRRDPVWTWLTSHYCSPAASSFHSDQRPLLRFNLKLMKSEHVPWKVVHGLCLKKKKKNHQQTCVQNWRGWMDRDMKLSSLYITNCKMESSSYLASGFSLNLLFCQKGMRIIWFHLVFYYLPYLD